jgi:hypothetical protein
MNRHLYAEANPATLIDPTGHKAEKTDNGAGGCIPTKRNNICGTDTGNGSAGGSGNNGNSGGSGCSATGGSAGTSLPVAPVVVAPTAWAPVAGVTRAGSDTRYIRCGETCQL